jgi:hypothetical protein
MAISNLHTTSVVARELQISRQRVLVLSRQGRIPGAQRLSGFWLFTRPFIVLPPASKRRQRRLQRRASG